jgi:hypothetical protein
MFIAHIIENGKHQRTRMFNTNRVTSDIAKELMLFQGAPQVDVTKELIICDENNYPLEPVR